MLQKNKKINYLSLPVFFSTASAQNRSPERMPASHWLTRYRTGWERDRVARGRKSSRRCNYCAVAVVSHLTERQDARAWSHLGWKQKLLCAAAAAAAGISSVTERCRRAAAVPAGLRISPKLDVFRTEQPISFSGSAQREFAQRGRGGVHVL